MQNTLDKTVLEDQLAMSMARAMAAANDQARREGVEVKRSLVTAAEHAGLDEACWRFGYGPRDYLRRRGGDLIIDVDLEETRLANRWPAV